MSSAHGPALRAGAQPPCPALAAITIPPLTILSRKPSYVVLEHACPLRPGSFPGTTVTAHRPSSGQGWFCAVLVLSSSSCSSNAAILPPLPQGCELCEARVLSQGSLERRRGRVRQDLELRWLEGFSRFCGGLEKRGKSGSFQGSDYRVGRARKSRGCFH